MARFITSAKVPYVLKADRERPEGERTTFFFKIMSVLENAEYADSLEWAPDPRDPKRVLPKNYEAHKTGLLRFTLVGWEGNRHPQCLLDAQVLKVRIQDRDGKIGVESRPLQLPIDLYAHALSPRSDFLFGLLDVAARRADEGAN